MMKIFINDEFDPESSAMMQALYSRSSASVAQHIEQVRKTGSADFMKSYYVGYGHASIGDCGTTTLFIEGVSILAAKAVQDNPLYSGQETSTRYIDFSKQPLIDPVHTEESQEILSKWIEFYTASTEAVRSHLKDRFPLEQGQKALDRENKKIRKDMAVREQYIKDLEQKTIPLLMNGRLAGQRVYHRRRWRVADRQAERLKR